MKRFFLALLIAVPGLAHAQETSQLIKPAVESTSSSAASAQPVETTPDKRIRVPSPADDERAQHVLNDLAKQSGWFPELKINVKSGMVTIEGHVKNADQLAWLAKTADRLPTVIAVINKATVDEPAVTDLTPAWSEFMRIMNRAKRALPTLGLAAVLLTFFFFISRLIFRGVHGLWRSNISNPFLLSTVSKLTMIPIWMLFFYLTLQTAGLSSLATTIIGGTGVLGIVIGFAFKDIAENYLSGLLLAIRSPFTKGDDVSVAGYDGYVQSLNMRGTTIKSYDGTLILIPNSMVIKEVIRNRTTNPLNRVKFTIGIGYNDSITCAQDLVMKALNEIPAVQKDPAPLVVVAELGTATVNIAVYFWMDVVKDSKFKTTSSAIARAKELLLANGISLPDESREVVFTDALKIQMLGDVDQVRSSEKERADAVKSKASDHLSESARNVNDTRATDDSKVGEGVDLLKSQPSPPPQSEFGGTTTSPER